MMTEGEEEFRTSIKSQKIKKIQCSNTNTESSTLKNYQYKDTNTKVLASQYT